MTEEVEIAGWVEYWRGGRYTSKEKERAAAISKGIAVSLLLNTKLHTSGEPPEGWAKTNQGAER